MKTTSSSAGTRCRKWATSRAHPSCMSFMTHSVRNPQSQEKKDAIRLYGAELVEVPAVPFKDPGNYVHASRRLAEEMNAEVPGSALLADQFDNTDNRRAHFETTGPEIWEALNGKVDGFICAVGTGGTLAGTGKFLQPRGVQFKSNLGTKYIQNLICYGYLKRKLSFFWVYFKV